MTPFWRGKLRDVSLLLIAVLGSVLGLGWITSSAGATDVHAHRGGPNAEGLAAYPENSISAFRHALARGWVIEFDLMRSSDGVAVVMHDAKLDRTTDCDGTVAAHTSEEISSCEIDVIGIKPVAEALPADDPRREPVPRLSEVLALLKTTGGRANIEVKDLTGDFHSDVYRQIVTSGVEPKKVILQSFAPPALESVPILLPEAGISLLTLNGSEYYFTTATKIHANWISPNWFEGMVDPAKYVARAHAQGIKVAPWTVDEQADLLAVGASGADAVISNDPTRAQRVLGRPGQAAPKLKLLINRSGGVKVRPGQTRVYTVSIANTGRVMSGPVRVTLRFPRKLLRLTGRAKRTLASVPAESSRSVGFRVKVRPGAGSRQKIRLTFAARDLNRPSGRLPQRTSSLRILPRGNR